jgi:hypothetical protein
MLKRQSTGAAPVSKRRQSTRTRASTAGPSKVEKVSKWRRTELTFGSMRLVRWRKSDESDSAAAIEAAEAAQQLKMAFVQEFGEYPVLRAKKYANIYGPAASSFAGSSATPYSSMQHNHTHNHSHSHSSAVSTGVVKLELNTPQFEYSYNSSASPNPLLKMESPSPFASVVLDSADLPLPIPKSESLAAAAVTNSTEDLDSALDASMQQLKEEIDPKLSS